MVDRLVERAVSIQSDAHEPTGFDIDVLEAAFAFGKLLIDTLTFPVNFSYDSRMQMKLELVAVPVSDVDRAKAFYTEKIGFHADHDHKVRDDLRFVQLTPPGSACSIVIGVGITDMPPGSLKGLQMVVSDVKEIRDELVKRGVAVSEIEAMPWGSFAYFSDPDGNRWSLQQLPVRT